MAEQLRAQRRQSAVTGVQAHAEHVAAGQRRNHALRAGIDEAVVLNPRKENLVQPVGHGQPVGQVEFAPGRPDQQQRQIRRGGHVRHAISQRIQPPSVLSTALVQRPQQLFHHAPAARVVGLQKQRRQKQVGADAQRPRAAAGEKRVVVVSHQRSQRPAAHLVEQLSG